MTDTDAVTIVRSPKSTEDPYVRVDRKTAQRDRKTGEGLTFAARGLMLYILSKPPGWRVKHRDLQKEGEIGRDALNTILKELREKGYIHRQQKRKGNGTFEWELTVYELPELNLNQCGKSALVTSDGLSIDGKSALAPNKDRAGARGIKIDNTDLQTKDLSKRKQPRFIHPAIKLFKEITKHLPKEASRPDVIEALSGTVNKEFLKTCYSTWINRGYNQWNLNWLFEWYAAGTIPPPPSGQRPAPPETTRTGPTLRRPLNWRELGITENDPAYIW